MDDAAGERRDGAAVYHQARDQDPMAALRRSVTAKPVPSHKAWDRRTYRRAVIVAVAAIAVVAGAGAVAMKMTSAPARPPAPSATIALPKAPPIRLGTKPAIEPGRASATPAALLELLGRMLRPTVPESPARSADGGLRVQAYLDDGRGPGMVRIAVTSGAVPVACRAGSQPDAVCRILPDGSQVSIVAVPDNCERRLVVSVQHPTGNRVDVDLADCLEFDGTTNPTGRVALSTDQAVALAADTRWGTTMATELVTSGAEHFDKLRSTPMSQLVDPLPSSGPRAGASVGRPKPGSIRPVTEGGLQWEDVDGDRDVDYCRRIGHGQGNTGRIACTLSEVSGFGRTITSAPLDWGAKVGRDWEDLDGDNNTDFCRRVGPADADPDRVACTLFTGTEFGATITSPRLDVGTDVGWAWDDVNGDNKVDYCRRLGVSGAMGRIACTLSTGRGFGATITSAVVDLGRDVGWEWEDVNGDDRSDYCRQLTPQGETGGAASGKVACTLSTGQGFGTTIVSQELDLGRDVGWEWEDANGDDRSDYCRRLTTSEQASGAGSGAAGVPAWRGQVGCTLSTGSGFGTTIVSDPLDLGGDVGVSWEDVNADARADYCRLLGAGPRASLACAPSTGTGFGVTIESSAVDGGLIPGSRWVDFNGDDRKDFCRRVVADGAQHLACTLSAGAGFGVTIESGKVEWGFAD